MRKIKKRWLTLSVAFLLFAGSFATSGQDALANGGIPADNGKDLATMTPVDQAGLVFVGNDIVGNCGFDNTILYYTQKQIEAIKDANGIPDTDVYAHIKGCYVKDLVFSSYENHGTGAYHYSRVAGLDILSMLSKVTSRGADGVTQCTVVASDGYKQIFRLNDLNNLKYYAPGDTVGTNAPSPVIALFKSSNEVTDQTSGVVPETCERLPVGDDVFLFGQTAIQDSNNCKFVRYANILSVGDVPAGVSSNSTILGGGLDELLEMGRYQTEYSYTDGGNIITHKVVGVPLSALISEKRLDKFMPSYVSYKILAETSDGKTVTIPTANVSKCFVAWGYSDGMEKPTGQQTTCSLYMPGTTESDTLLKNLSKITVVSAANQVVTKIPPCGPTVRASTAGYNSVKLSWSAVDNGTGYYIYRYDTVSKTYKAIKDVGSATSYIDTGRTTGTTYYYRVASYTNNKYDAAIKITGGTSVTVSAKPTLATAAISSLYKSGRHTVIAKWNKISGATGYQIYSATNKTFTKGTKLTTIAGGTVSSAKLGSLTVGKTYYLKVRAYRTVSGMKQYGAFSSIKYIKR